MAEVVTINVGGKVFCTLRDTLLQDNSYFNGLLSGEFDVPMVCEPFEKDFQSYINFLYCLV